MDFDLRGKRVFVAGHRGMVGSAIVRRLAGEECTILTAGRDALDLRVQDQVNRWMAENKPDAVFMAAATVGGIVANDSRPAEFIYDNVLISTNLIEAARQSGTSKYLFLGSSCIYPKLASQPMTEEELLTGPLEPTNQWYAIAKIAGIKLGQAFRRQYGLDVISAMPTNLYGVNDYFDLRNSHVIPALLAKAHKAKTTGQKTMEVWGSGQALREFLHADDLADACVFLMKKYSSEDFVNVGTGQELSIAELARLVCETVGFEGELVFDRTKPDGTPRKLLDTSRLSGLGWQPTISLREGLRTTYEWFLSHQQEARGV